jgi:hypothetical protein
MLVPVPLLQKQLSKMRSKVFGKEMCLLQKYIMTSKQRVRYVVSFNVSFPVSCYIFLDQIRFFVYIIVRSIESLIMLFYDIVVELSCLDQFINIPFIIQLFCFLLISLVHTSYNIMIYIKNKIS